MKLKSHAQILMDRGMRVWKQMSTQEVVIHTELKRNLVQETSTISFQLVSKRYQQADRVVVRIKTAEASA